MSLLRVARLRELESRVRVLIIGASAVIQEYASRHQGGYMAIRSRILCVGLRFEQLTEALGSSGYEVMLAAMLQGA
jgi:hypothetical protein